MHRRLFLAALSGAAAAPNLLWAATKEPVSLGKAFPYYDLYLKLPPAERNRFAMAYYVMRDGKPAAGLKAWIIEGATRTPIVYGADGHAPMLPTLAQLQSAMIQFDVPQDVKLKPTPELRATLASSTQLDAAAIGAAIVQADTAAHKMAGGMAFIVPKIAAAQFPGAGSGQAVAPGRAMPLAAGKYGPVYNPAKEPGARTIALAKAPNHIMLTPAT